ncbi:hypothetical protein AMECASPLE_033769 [Ameca splendens]|uniref:Uncharacterized protein n=1 Tax=Ameca splendens TaxID=208324 RepID=A0ABV0Y6T0_9TELE
MAFLCSGLTPLPPEIRIRAISHEPNSSCHKTQVVLRERSYNLSFWMPFVLKIMFVYNLFLITSPKLFSFINKLLVYYFTISSTENTINSLLFTLFFTFPQFKW